MTRADFINRFKNHINIDENNHVANAEVEVFINSHIVNNTLIMKWFILICNVEPVSSAKFTLALIEFVKSNSLLKSQMRDTFHKTAYD